MTDPRSGIGAHEFTYDGATGRLLTDEDLDDAGGSSGPVVELSLPDDIADDWTEVTFSRAADSLDGAFTDDARDIRYQLRGLGTNLLERRVEHGSPSSLSWAQVSEPADGRMRTREDSTGMTVHTYTAPHPVYGMAAPYVRRTEVTRPVAGTVTFERELDYATAADPLCLGTTRPSGSYCGTTSVDPSPTGTGIAQSSWSLVTSGSERVLTITAPSADASRQTEVRFDSRGRLTRLTAPGHYPRCITYAGNSTRPTQVIEGPLNGAGTACDSSSVARRQVNYAYTARWLTGVTNGYGSSSLATLFARDLRGAIDLVDLPARQTYNGVSISTADIDATYDEIGNLTSFRPARRASPLTPHDAYAYGLTPRGRVETYTPPATSAYSGAEVTSVDYRPDGRIYRVDTRATTGSTARWMEAHADPDTGFNEEIETYEGSPPPSGVGGSETYALAHDADGRLFDSDGPGGGLGLEYDGRALREQTWSVSGSGGVDGRVTRTSLASGVLTQEAVCFGASCTAPSAGTITYAHDVDGLLTSAGGTGLTADVIGTTFGALGATVTSTTGSVAATDTVVSGEESITTHRWTPTSATLYENSVCARDGLGRVIARREALRTSPTSAVTYVVYAYDYDTAGRLSRYRRWTGATLTCLNYTTFTPSTDRSIAYDEQGNRTGLAANEADQPTVDGRVYDGAGRLRSLGGGGVTVDLSYDLRGQLRRFAYSVGSPVYAEAYDYDPLGRLVRMRPTLGTVTVDQRFVYRDGLNPIGWQRPHSTYVATCSGTTDTWYFVYGTSPQTPDLAYVDACSDGSVNRTFRYAFDDRGSVRALFDVATGNQFVAISYDEWGAPTFTTPVSGMSAFDAQPFGYAGAIYMGGAGLWHMGARDYDPSIGTWTAPDPIHFGGGMNLYAYCGNEPVNRTDHAGRYHEGANSPPPWLPDWLRGLYDMYYGSDRMIESAIDRGADRGWSQDAGQEADAYRHCVWMCQSTESYGSDVATCASWGHEAIGLRQTPWGHDMDYDNNEWGTLFGEMGFNCEASCEAAVEDGTLTTLLPGEDDRVF